MTDMYIRFGKLFKALERRLVAGVGIPGFSDVFHDAGLDDTLIGVGLYYNNYRCAQQLAASIILTAGDSDIVMEIIGNGSDAGKNVRSLREAHIMHDVKLIDLGSGLKPTFGLAAKALGAEVYTADGQQLPEPVEIKLNGHITLDLSRPESAAQLQQGTGGNFDLVTENIISPTIPGQSALTHAAIEAIAIKLLRVGGYFYRPPDRILQH